MIIIAATLDFADQATCDTVVRDSAPIQQATRDDEPGCRAYCFATDPCVPGRIQVYELWDDSESLAAHFRHPNYLAMRDLIRSHQPTGAANRAYLVERDEPVYGPNGEFRDAFFAEG